MRNILIGGAWPYANGSLHIGHLAALLPGDVLARYHRACQDHVCFVSGSDCHGTPVALRAKKEGKTPQEISDQYHEEFKDCFEKLGFSYDYYEKTSDEKHKKFVTEFHKHMYQSNYVYEKEVPQAYCDTCQTFLADRFVTGICPVCGGATRGDQCDQCGTVLEPENLISPVCAICGKSITFKKSKHLYIAISALEKELRALVNEASGWRKNAISFTNRYLNEGVRDRALTRDLEWGIEVPRDGYEKKTIYIWAENVLGYLSASKCACEEQGADFEALWNRNAKHYYVHGKDNIPFHTIILPALLIANGAGWHLPDQIVSSEYMTLEGRKISTSQNYAIWVKDLVGKYDADSIRYFFLVNGPEKKDADFSWREFVNSHNGELLGAYGNFINRSLSFIVKYWDGIVPEGELNQDISRQIGELFTTAGRLIEKGACKDALTEIFDFIRKANKYFDTETPWITRTTNEKACRNTLFQCTQMIANLAVLLAPFLPFSSQKVCGWLNVQNQWKQQSIPGGYHLPKIQLLFERLDKSVIVQEEEKLKKLSET